MACVAGAIHRRAAPAAGRTPLRARDVPIATHTPYSSCTRFRGTTMRHVHAVSLLLLALVPAAQAAQVQFDPAFATDGFDFFSNPTGDISTVAHVPGFEGESYAILRRRSSDPAVCPAQRTCVTIVHYVGGVRIGAVDVAPAIQFTQLNDAAFDGEGRIVLVGSIALTAPDVDFRVARVWGSSGAADTSFSGDGVANVAFDLGGGFIDAARAVAIDGGRIVVAGTVQRSADDADFGVARLLGDGTLDTSFSSDGKREIFFNLHPDLPFDTASSVAITPDGKILVGGEALDSSSNTNRVALARLNDNGTLDASFCEVACNFSDVYPTINSGRRVIFYGDATPPLSTSLDALDVHADGTFLTAGSAEIEVGVETGYVQMFDANGQWLTETLTNGGNDGEARINGVHWEDHDDPASGVIVTGVTGAQLGWFFAQRLQPDLAPSAGWGNGGPGDSVMLWWGTQFGGDVGNNTSARSAIASDGRILLGGSYRAGSVAADDRAIVTQIVPLSAALPIFADGFEGDIIIGR